LFVVSKFRVRVSPLLHSQVSTAPSLFSCRWLSSSLTSSSLPHVGRRSPCRRVHRLSHRYTFLLGESVPPLPFPHAPCLLPSLKPESTPPCHRSRFSVAACCTRPHVARAPDRERACTVALLCFPNSLIYLKSLQTSKICAGFIWT
jgi:hypothetical protein